MIPAVLSACFGAIGYGFGSVLEGAAARRATGLAVMLQPVFVLGILLDVGAWIASVVALQFLTVFTVQAILASSLAVTVLAARLVWGTPMTRSKLIAMVLVGSGLVAVVASTGAQSADAPPSQFEALSLICLLLLAAAVALVYSRTPPFLLALLAGLAFSGAALAARGLAPGDSIADFAGQPLLWGIVGFGIVGLIGYSRSLESGAVGGVTAVLWVVEVVVPGIIGVWIFGDAARPGFLGWKLIGLAVTLAGCVWLALEESRADEQAE